MKMVGRSLLRRPLIMGCAATQPYREKVLADDPVALRKERISNAAVVEAYVKKHLTTDRAKPIMKECETPRTRSHLKAHFGFNNDAALDHHFKPLREADLIRQRVEEDGTLVFEWSNMFRRLPKSSIKMLLGDTK